MIALRPQGRLEGSPGRVFRRTVAVLSALPDAQVEVDLAAVPEMDAASVLALADAARRLGRDGGRLRLVGARRQLRDLLVAVDLGDGAAVPATLPPAA